MKQKYAFSLQILLEIQNQYNMPIVEEKGVNIKTENFDPVKSHVTLMLRSSELDSGLWIPNYLPDIHWNEDTKTFTEVQRHAEWSTFHWLARCDFCNCEEEKK